MVVNRIESNQSGMLETFSVSIQGGCGTGVGSRLDRIIAYEVQERLLRRTQRGCEQEAISHLSKSVVMRTAALS